VTITSKRLDEVQTVDKSQQKLTKDSSLSSIPSVTAKLPTKKLQVETTKKSSSARAIQLSSSTGQIQSALSTTLSKAVKESNYTPSISSIGSNVLRSKTADFERMSDPSKKSRISAAMNFPALQTSHNVQSLQAKIQSPTNANVTNISISLKGSTSSSSSTPAPVAPKKKTSVVEETAPPTSEKRSMPIYKRQEIISSSSVQKTIKK
jgi:hypothetical protein